MTGDPAVELAYVNVNGGHTHHVMEAHMGASGLLLLTWLHCTACTLLPSTIACRSGDSAPASLASHCWDTPPPSPGPAVLPHSYCCWLPAAVTMLLPPATLLHHRPSPPESQVSYIWTTRCTPIFLLNLGGCIL